MLKLVENPKTPRYLEFKEYLLNSLDLPWYYMEQSTPKLHKEKYVDIEFFSHVFLDRAEEKGYPVSCSKLTERAVEVCKEIIDWNKIQLITLLRLNANFISPYFRVVNTVPHLDHSYNHKNLLIYLTKAGGNTIVENESHDPKEDDVIIFQGKHYAQTPISERRVVLVATFIDEEMVK